MIYFQPPFKHNIVSTKSYANSFSDPSKTKAYRENETYIFFVRDLVFTMLYLVLIIDDAFTQSHSL